VKAIARSGSEALDSVACLPVPRTADIDVAAFRTPAAVGRSYIRLADRKVCPAGADARRDSQDLLYILAKFQPRVPVDWRNFMGPPTTIFQASDLNRRGRSVLDAAREGLARIRDTDGVSLVVAPEAEFQEMRDRLEDLRRLTDAMASFITLDRAVDHDHREPSLSELGSWTWVRMLPAEDAAAFLHDIAEALYASCREMTSAPLAAVLSDWRATAEALSDPLARETLLARNTADEYVEVERPEVATDVAAASG
jgi:hypothetical protein